MTVSRLAYLGANATDVAAWKKYATEVLGFEIGRESGDRLLYLRADERHHRLSIHPAENDDVAYVGWELANHQALEAAASVLESNGVKVASGTSDELAERRVLELASFTCPYTGIRMELTVGNEVAFYPRFTSTRDLSGFIMGDQGLGHVVLFTTDVQAAAEFYVRTLGFGISDYVLLPDGAPIGAFLHCNRRHHSLAFFAVPMGPRGKKMQHLMIEADSLDTSEPAMTCASNTRSRSRRWDGIRTTAGCRSTSTVHLGGSSSTRGSSERSIPTTGRPRNI